MVTQQSSVKRAQKESLLHQLLLQLYLQLMLDDKRLQGMSITRVKLSPDKSVCSVFFHTDQGELGFKERFNTLVLYKPSLRKAIADAIPSRYVPNLVFKYDAQVEKQQRVEEILKKIKDEAS